MPYAVQDATATVVEIQFARTDEKARQHNRKDPVLQNLKPEGLLDELPVAVLIRLHECKHIFLPVQPCADCPTPTATCPACMRQPKVSLRLNPSLGHGNMTGQG